MFGENDQPMRRRKKIAAPVSVKVAMTKSGMAWRRISLAGTRTYRFAGSGVPTLTVPADFGMKFDAVLYVGTSTPTQLRHWPTF